LRWLVSCRPARAIAVAGDRGRRDDQVVCASRAAGTADVCEQAGVLGRDVVLVGNHSVEGTG
jgi:hypothetical protein